MILNEPGVLAKSEKYFSTPAELTKNLFYYVTRCGHYFCDKNYYYNYQSSNAKIASRLNYLLFYIIEGRLEMNIEGRKFSAEKDQIVFIDCKKPHDYYSSGNLEFLWIHIDGANTEKFYEQIILSKGNKQAFGLPNASEVYRCMLKILSSFAKNRGLPQMERSQTIYKILCNLLLTPNTEYDSWDDDSQIGQVIHYIDQNLNSNIAIDAIAASIKLSLSNFYRYFKKNTGYSPHQFIILKRIDKAKFLLNTTSMSIKEIAFEVGYNSESNFITSFIANVGVSPNTFRQNPI